MPHEGKPLTIRTKNDKVIISFNKEGWNDVYGHMLKQLCHNKRDEHTVAEVIQHSLHLLGLEEYGDFYDKALQGYQHELDYQRQTRAAKESRLTQEQRARETDQDPSP